MTIILFCCFFLISGRIVYSIGTDFLMNRGQPHDSEIPIDPALLQAAAEQKPGEESDSDPERDRGWGENPFRCLEQLAENTDSIAEEGAPAGGGGLELQGVSFGGGGPFAVINDEPLATGETIKGYEIVEIVMDRVVLKKGDETVVLELGDPEK